MSMLASWRRLARENELLYLFLNNRVAQIAAVVSVLCLGGAALASFIAPTNPYDIASIDIMDSLVPPMWSDDSLMIVVLTVAIGLSLWVNFARTVRASTFVERNKEYVQASEIMGLHPLRIMLTHILPNIMGPILVILTVDLAVAVLLEATLSFLGVGVPPNQPSLGTLIRVGTEYMFSGEWWIVIFPSGMLITMIIAINILGDFLRDALNPRLR